MYTVTVYFDNFPDAHDFVAGVRHEMSELNPDDFPIRDVSDVEEE